jgi:hypothetical protein
VLAGADLAGVASAQKIDPATGEFDGAAWAENLGWVSFAADGPYAFRMKTAWNCEPAPAVPPGGAVLSLAQDGAETALSWTDLPGSSAFDLLHGDVTTLRTAVDAFEASTIGCVSERRSMLSATFADEPTPGQGYWFLVRGANCGGNGSYDDERDEAISDSGRDCP